MIDLPKSWRTKKLKYLFKYSLSSVDRHVYDEELSVHICHYPDVYYNDKIDSVKSLPTGTCTPDELEKFQVLSGDILITKDSESPEDIGVPCLISTRLKNTVCGYHLGIIRHQSEMDTEYVFRFLQTDYAKGYFYCESSGVTRFGVGKPSVENLELPIPPLEEQRLISHYLGKKTEQIDILIKKMSKKIELLKEKRISLIGQCVTKGLDPHVQMKDSGVEWIGKMPNSWRLIRGRFLFEFKKEINTGLKNENLLSLTLFGVLNKEYYSSEGLRPETYSTYQIFSKNDLVFKMIDLENVNTSRVGLVHETGIMSPVYIRHEPKTDKIDPRFSYWFYFDLYKKEIYNSIGSGVRSALKSSDLLELRVPVPTLKEQKIISRHLDKKTGQIDILIEKIQKKNSLLSEYRQSLISSVVTGKVRVTEKMI